MSYKVIREVLYIGRWVLMGVCAGFAVLVLLRIPIVVDQQKTADRVAYIQGQKITQDDVRGTHKPQAPNVSENSATRAGVDSNTNGIRDDVERSIIEHTTDLPTRAAELQYARALQFYVTDVFNKETWAAAATQEDRAYQCLGQALRRSGIQEDSLVFEMSKRTTQLQELVLNTPLRKEAYTTASKYVTGFGLPDDKVCDVVYEKN